MNKSDNFKKWYDICFSAENVASEVLNCEEAKNELSVQEFRDLFELFGDDEYVDVNDDKNIVNKTRGE